MNPTRGSACPSLPSCEALSIRVRAQPEPNAPTLPPTHPQSSASGASHSPVEIRSWPSLVCPLVHRLEKHLILTGAVVHLLSTCCACASVSGPILTTAR